MGGVASNVGGLRQRYRLRGRREEPGAVVAENGGQKADECYVKRDFDGGKGAALEIWQAWQGRRRRQCRRGVIRWGSELLVLGCWGRDR